MQHEAIHGKKKKKPTKKEESKEEEKQADLTDSEDTFD